MALLLVVSAILTACGSGSKTSTGARGTGSASTAKTSVAHVTITVDPNSASLPEFVAQKEGFFKQNHLAVSITPQTNISLIPVELVRHQFDFGTSVAPILLAAAAKGLPLVQTTGGQIDALTAPQDAMLVRKGTSVKDLSGEKVGVPALAGEPPTCVVAWFAHYGFHYTVKTLPVQLVTVAFQNMNQQLQAGLIGGALQTAPYWQEATKSGNLVALGPDPCAVVSSKNVTVQAFLASSSIWANSHRAVVAAVDRALQEAITYIKGHQTTARKIEAASTGISYSVLQQVPLSGYNATPSVSAIQTWYDAMRADGQFTATVDPRTLVLQNP